MLLPLPSEKLDNSLLYLKIAVFPFVGCAVFVIFMFRLPIRLSGQPIIGSYWVVICLWVVFVYFVRSAWLLLLATGAVLVGLGFAVLSALHGVERLAGLLGLLVALGPGLLSFIPVGLVEAVKAAKAKKAKDDFPRT